MESGIDIQKPATTRQIFNLNTVIKDAEKQQVSYRDADIVFNCLVHKKSLEDKFRKKCYYQFDAVS